MDRIVIFGDSWACGEWGTPDGTPDSYQVVHAGLGEILKTKYQVQNLARGGSSLWDILHRLTVYISLNTHVRYDTENILVFQTSPTRKDRAEQFGLDYANLFCKHDKLDQLCLEILEIWYIKLDQLAAQHDVKFYMIGGLTDLQPEIMSAYKNLVVLCDSWQSLLNARHAKLSHCLFPEKYALEFAHKVGNTTLVKNMLDRIDASMPQCLDLMSVPTMGPVDHHPNRDGHSVMANHILEFLDRN